MKPHLFFRSDDVGTRFVRFAFDSREAKRYEFVTFVSFGLTIVHERRSPLIFTSGNVYPRAAVALALVASDIESLVFYPVRGTYGALSFHDR